MLFWWIAGVLFLVLELFTLSFVLVYFGLGAIVAALAGTLGMPLAGQTGIFCAVSLGLLFTTRPYIVRMVQKAPYRPSNVETLTGKIGIVTIPISNDASTGQVRIGTEFWTARTDADVAEPIPSGTKVRILGVEGVTARVVAAEELAASPSAGDGEPIPKGIRVRPSRRRLRRTQDDPAHDADRVALEVGHTGFEPVLPA